jgi:PAS domain S-box-containing protein
MPPKRSTIRSIASAASLHGVPTATDAEGLADVSPILLVTSDAAGRLSFVNSAWERLLGWAPEELAGLTASDLVHPGDRGELRRALIHARGTRAGVPGVELRTAARDGRWRGFSWHMRLDGGRWYGAGVDLGGTRRVERALAASQSRFRVLVEQLPAIVYTAGKGADAEWEYVSPQIETLLGYSPEEWMASNSLWFEVIHPDDRERVLAEEAAIAEPGGQLRSEYRVRRRDGEWLWLRDDATAIIAADGKLQFQGVLLDITEAKHAEQAVRDKHDQLQAIIDNSPVVIFAKDLEHRYLLMNREAEEIVDAEPGGALGKTDFDLVPPELAQRYVESDRRLFESGAPLEEELPAFVRGQHRTFLVHRFPLRSHEGDVYGLCAIATDISERKAREDALRAKVEWSFRIRDAVQRDRLVLHAQPIVEIASGQMVQEELLVRMLPDGDKALIMPGEFLPPAERFGLIPAIDRWVVSKAVGMARDRRVEVNLSGQSLSDVDLPDFIESEIRAAGADPSHLVFEVTETAAAEDLQQARRLAQRLVELGCGFALDDFGTGYGSFTYLKHLPVSYIKIDMEFVRELTSHSADLQVVKSIVDVARNFGIQTIAEGVESQQALEVLEGVGVDFAQGYHLGRPAPTPGGGSR